MGSFSGKTTADPPQPQAPAPDASKKIILNFGGRASKAVLAMAAATLEAGGYVEAPPREPEVGDEMPDGTKYAGISPDTGNPMYVTPADAPLTMKWKEAMDYAAKLARHRHTHIHDLRGCAADDEVAGSNGVRGEARRAWPSGLAFADPRRTERAVQQPRRDRRI